MEYATTIKTTVAAGAALWSYIFGWPDMWLTALIIAIAADYVTGLCKAYILGELSSRVGFKGIVRKVMYFAIVAVAVIADNLSNAGGSVRAAVLGFLVCNEALSILENCAAADLPVPTSLLKLLNKIKSGDGEEE